MEQYPYHISILEKYKYFFDNLIVGGMRFWTLVFLWNESRQYQLSYKTLYANANTKNVKLEY